MNRWSPLRLEGHPIVAGLVVIFVTAELRETRPHWFSRSLRHHERVPASPRQPVPGWSRWREVGHAFRVVTNDLRLRAFKWGA